MVADLLSGSIPTSCIPLSESACGDWCVEFVSGLKSAWGDTLRCTGENDLRARYRRGLMNPASRRLRHGEARKVKLRGLSGYLSDESRSG